MKWSILILTMPRRKQFLDRLLDVLGPQLTGDVELIVNYSIPEKSIGENRQMLLNQAHGEYVSFIDDDDLVAGNYVSSILPLLDGVDYIGFPVKVFRDGVFYGNAFHSLKNKQWSCHGDTSFRDISHLNPIKREHALKAKLSGDFGEDHRWANEIRALGIVQTEHYVPEPMYFYYMRTKKETA